jgi:DNA repair exonuclease SbcCD ATPase subunit
MARPSDREFELKRQIKELKEQNEKLETKIKILNKQLEKLEKPVEVKTKPRKPVSKACPDCGAEIKHTDMPHGVLELCSAGCGHRRVRNK